MSTIVVNIRNMIVEYYYGTKYTFPPHNVTTTQGPVVLWSNADPFHALVVSILSIHRGLLQITEISH